MSTTIGKCILFKLHTIYNVNKYFLTLDLVPSQLTGALFCFLFQLNDENMFEWEVALFGPPETLYQGGYFKVTS